MNELKLYIDDLEAFEACLLKLGGRLDEVRSCSNWYLQTTQNRVVKIVRTGSSYSWAKLRKLNQGFSFADQKPLEDLAPFHLERVAEHNVLHKVERQWKIGTQSIDILVFDSIGTFACVNYADGEIEISTHGP